MITRRLVRKTSAAIALAAMLLIGAAVAWPGSPPPLTAPISIGPAGAPSQQALPWPRELPHFVPNTARLYETPKANYVTDLHGNPNKADLVIFMAGNQYPALPDLTAAFQRWQAEHRRDGTYPGNPVKNIFYATTPPGALIQAMDGGALVVGNLVLTVSRTEKGGIWPDVFLTGSTQQLTLCQRGYSTGHFVYSRGRGVGLLVKDGNPLGITGVADLARPEVRVTISSPAREAASHNNYRAVIDAQGGAGLTNTILAKPNTLSPLNVHHRENPQFIADDAADVAPMFFHFGQYLTGAFPSTFDFVQLPDAGQVHPDLAMTKVVGGQHKDAAEAWIRFMRTQEARDIYTAHGFDYASDAELNTRVVPCTPPAGP
jgi:accessory colonization factor AcfC